MSKNDEHKVIVGIGSPLPPDTSPVIVLGMPEKAWDYMADGQTHTFDLNKVGIPVRVLIFRGKDHAEVAKLMQEGAMASGAQFIDHRGKDGDLPDLGIDQPTLN